MADIIKFSDKKPVQILPRSTCFHERVDVGEEDRSLECRDCGIAVDPLDWIINWAKGNSHHEHYREQLKLECERLGRKKAKLVKLEKKHRERLKKAGVRIPSEYDFA